MSSTQIACFFVVASLSAVRTAATEDTYAFEEYKRTFDRKYKAGSDEHELRQAIFEARVEEIRAHNAKSSSWRMGVNHLTDLTEEELDARSGYKPAPRARSDSAGSSLMQAEPSQGGRSCGSHQASCLDTDSTCCSGLICGGEGRCVKTQTTPDEFDWSPQLATSKHVLEQGHCGSCWAVSATAALQFHAELSRKGKSGSFSKILSPQGMLSCTPNEHHCGGQGGCHGATAELGYEWVKASGRVLDIETQPYKAKSEGCASSFLRSEQGVSVGGWKKITENNAEAMMVSLVNVGPLVASIAARGIHSYESGVISHEDDENLILNHAVVMMGYGMDRGLMYWKLRNSWGKRWGEKGFFRIQRFAPHGDEPCGEDTDPGKGVVCEKEDGTYQETQTVCGTMGILSDTAYPVGTKVSSSMLDDTDTERAAVAISAKGAVEDDDEDDDDDEERLKARRLTRTNSKGCKTRCQHFEFAELAKTYNTDFGDDPDHCEKVCDKVLRRA